MMWRVSSQDAQRLEDWGFKLEQAGEALRHGCVMISSVVFCQVRGQDAQELVRGAAQDWKQPGSL